MISHVQCRSILNRISQPDNWFGLWYNVNLYRGCSHRCVYCDSRSECYSIENFDGEILVKANAIELLSDRLPRLRVKGTIGTGSMNDPYQPLERKIGLTRRALEVIAFNHFPVHVITKSDLVLRDIDILKEISKVYSAVTFTITTVDNSIASRIEPGAPSVEARFEAIRELSMNGIHVGITLMPILPFITDSIDNLNALIEQASRCGVEYIIASFGVTLRDRQRDYFLRKVEKLFPGMGSKYSRQFGSSYLCRSSNAEQLEVVFTEKCHVQGISTSMPVHDPLDTGQLSLF
ncbi:MAG: radical SAM protein [Candidatus Aegiribacteria sp.]|nr:radical SAM protein [Candidatus Aegiribacteria sp.]